MLTYCEVRHQLPNPSTIITKHITHDVPSSPVRLAIDYLHTKTLQSHRHIQYCMPVPACRSRSLGAFSITVSSCQWTWLASCIFFAVVNLSLSSSKQTWNVKRERQTNGITTRCSCWENSYQDAEWTRVFSKPKEWAHFLPTLNRMLW